MISANRLQSSWPESRRQEPMVGPTLADIKQSAQSAFESYPVGAVFAAFGLGFTFGLALSTMFEQEPPSRRRWY